MELIVPCLVLIFAVTRPRLTLTWRNTQQHTWRLNRMVKKSQELITICFFAPFLGLLLLIFLIYLYQPDPQP